jgi:hypothetical protein
MPLQATSGAVSQDAFGGNGVAVVPTYIEDVFSTWLYTGNGSTQTITNGIDLDGEGGLVWIKDRNSGAKGHALFDTVRGGDYKLQSQSSNGQFYATNQVTSFNADGFSLGSSGDPNGSGTTYASWTFRKQPKFFDVVTYTGNGSSNRQISHSLESAPACMIIKRTDSGGSRWNVYHRAASATPQNGRLALNTTDAYVEYPTIPSFNTLWNLTQPTSTNFTVGSNADVNGSGGTYVAYLFAHDAGGFGLTGTDNVISCGSYSHTNGSNTTVTLGFEPQFVINRFTGIGIWVLMDSLRGMPVSGVNGRVLQPQSADAEEAGNTISPTATGFIVNSSLETGTYIYIAIRRGPMKVPTTGTSVFAPSTVTQTANVPLNMGFPADFFIARPARTSGTGSTSAGSRLQGGLRYLFTNRTDAEAGAGTWNFDSNIGLISPYGGEATQVTYGFRRTPNFFDVVCYTGTGSNQTLPHNLGAVPQLMITKNRSNASNWRVYDAFNGPTKRGSLNDSQPWDVQSSMWNDTAPTSTVFTVGTSNSASSQTYVIYLFTTCAGVSKVGSYTGTGTTQTINCGFTAGSRFVMIKRTDSTGDWYYWDSARGIVSGNDPYLLLNSTAAEVTSTDYVDTYSTGFEITSTAPAAINASGGTYIFLAIA